MRLILVRHAESEHSRRGVIADLAGCTGLTANGVRQAQALCERLRATAELRDYVALLSSPVSRARQTADILTQAVGAGPIVDDHDLREIIPGAADGLTWDVYQATYGAFDLIAEPDRPFAPQGESWQAFLDRVRMTLQRLAARYPGQTVLAVTHAGFVVASLLVTFAIPRPGTGAWLEPRHTSLTIWEVAATRWQLERYNDTSHLEHRS